MPKPTPRPPRDAQAILNHNYRHLGELDAAGWHDKLTRIYALFIKLGGLGIADPLPNVTLMEENRSTIMILPHVPTVQVMNCCREPNGRFVIRPGAQYARLEPDGVLGMLVNLNAPGAVIIAEVKRTLKEVRKVHPPAVGKPGRAALNGQFDARMFAKWRREKIVQMARLLAWRAGLDKRAARTYPDRVIGNWLEFRSAKHISKAKATLKKALANLPALTAQIDQERDELRFAASLRFSNRSASYHYKRISG